MEDVFEMAAPEVNFLVLLLWVAMAALLIVLIVMGGQKPASEAPVRSAQGSLSPGTGYPKFPIVQVRASMMCK